MSHHRYPLISFLMTSVFLVGLGLPCCASAQSALPDEVSEWSVDGGGGTSIGGVYDLTGTFGQADAGIMTEAVFEVEGGLWHAGSPAVPVELMSFEIVSGDVPSSESLGGDPPSSHRREAPHASADKRPD